MIKKDFKNGLLKRREIVIEIKHGENPGNEGSRKMIAEQLKADESLIAIKKVEGNFGSDNFVIEAFIYDSAEARDKIEPKKKEKKANA